MTVTNELPPFDSDDRVALRNFLGTRAGQRLFSRAAADCPQLLTEGETNAILCRTGEVTGFMKALQTLSALTVEDKPASVDSATYPAPEDDDLWKDGRKLNPNP